MKCSLAVLALMTVAGTAMAQTATPPGSPAATPSVGGNTVTQAAPAAPSISTPAPSTSGGTVATTPPTARGAAMPSTVTGSMGTTAPGVSPPSTATGAPSMAPNTASAPALPNAPGSAGALKRIEADGYKNISGLTRNPDGSWSGKAMRGGSMVDVQVDARGNVVTR